MKRILAMVFIVLSLSSFAQVFAESADAPILKLDTGGHMAVIKKIIAMGDGRRIISASDDKTIRIWDTSTGQETTKILGQIGGGSEGQIFAIALIPDRNIQGQAPDERWLTVGGFLAEGHGVVGAIRIYDPKTGALIKVLKSHEDVVNDLSVSKDGRYLVSGSADTTVKVWDIADNFRLTHTFKGHTKEVYAVRVFKSGGDYKIVSAGYDNKAILWSLRDKRDLNSYMHTDKLKYLALSEGYIAASGFQDNKIVIFDHNLKSIKEIESETNPSGLSFSPDGRLLLAGTGTSPRVCNIYDSQAGFRKITSFNKHDNLAQATAFLNNRTAVTGGGNNNDIYIWDAFTGEVKEQITGHGKMVWSVGIRGREIAFGNTSGYENHNSRGKLEKSINLETYSVNKLTQSPIDTFGDKSEGFKRIDTNYQGYSLTHATGGDYGYDAVLLIKKDGSVTARITRDSTDGYRHNTYGWTGDGTIISGGVSGFLTAYNRQGQKTASFIGHTGEVWGIAIDGDTLVSGSDDQTIKLWDLRELKNLKPLSIDYEKLKQIAKNWAKIQPDQKWTIKSVKSSLDSQGQSSEYMKIPEIKPIVSIFISGEDEWVVWSEEGFFNASKNGAKYIGYHINKGPEKEAGFVPVDKLYNSFYRPDLIEARLNGRDISEYARKINIATILKGGLPPRVEMRTVGGMSKDKDIMLKARLCDTGDGIGDITMFINNIPVSIEHSDRGVKIVGKEKSAPVNCTDFERLISLQNGTNKIGIMAYNKGNTIESNRAEIELVYKSKTIEKPDLHILTIAIDKYNDIDLRLKYSVNDANGIIETIKKRSAQLFKNIHVYSIHNSEATKDNIRKKFEEIKDKTGTEDVFLLFIAGHGITYNVDGSYYYLPVDFRYTSPESIPKFGVSIDDFKRYLTNVKALKSLLLVDTCNSGSFAEAISNRGMLEKTAVNKLTRAVGRSTLVASSKDQVALEGFEGHGVFTYSVLKALNGLERYRNNQLTINDLATFVEETLPAITMKKWGYEQIPQKNLQGMDFPIGVK